MKPFTWNCRIKLHVVVYIFVGRFCFLHLDSNVCTCVIRKKKTDEQQVYESKTKRKRGKFCTTNTRFRYGNFKSDGHVLHTMTQATVVNICFDLLEQFQRQILFYQLLQKHDPK